ncbi:hypothetical protein [Nocardia asiatica]|uniref:hypothetical protein n=1 Tax=Nocardia asiatica TaxID=209252 RepID=UPI002457E09E|nr:hypothetical protein [Nocardia asiatica]
MSDFPLIRRPLGSDGHGWRDSFASSENGRTKWAPLPPAQDIRPLINWSYTRVQVVDDRDTTYVDDAGFLPGDRVWIEQDDDGWFVRVERVGAEFVRRMSIQQEATDAE